MPQEKGQVTPSGNLSLYVTLQSGLAIECVIDTGFNGWLSLPRQIVEDLRLPITGKEDVELLGKATQSCLLAAAEIVWLGAYRTVSVLVNEGDERLIGTGLLVNAILHINCCNGKVSIRPCKPKHS